MIVPYSNIEYNIPGDSYLAEDDDNGYLYLVYIEPDSDGSCDVSLIEESPDEERTNLGSVYTSWETEEMEILIQRMDLEMRWAFNDDRLTREELVKIWEWENEE